MYWYSDKGVYCESALLLKTKLEELAIMGGAPAFAEARHVGRPNIGNRATLLSRINDILDRRWLTNNGAYVQAFERQIAEMVGVRNCVAVCNGTVALEILIRALELTGEVIIPSFTFIATAHALQWQMIRPVFCDLESKRFTLDPVAVEQCITPVTSAIIGVHLWGRPCCIEELQSIADAHGLKLIFDAAHAFGCSYRGCMIGRFGNAEVFSFHATKYVNAFEGGAVVTNDDQLAEKMRLMRNFGFSGYDNVVYVGTNGKMSEVSAAMGLTSMESMDEFVLLNRENYNTYRQQLDRLPGIHCIHYADNTVNNYQYMIALIEKECPFSRDELIRILHAENILVRRYFYPGCHRSEPYRSMNADNEVSLPVTEALCESVLLFPTGSAIGKEDIRRIGRVIQLALENAGIVRASMQAELGLQIMHI